MNLKKYTIEFTHTSISQGEITVNSENPKQAEKLAQKIYDAGMIEMDAKGGDLDIQITEQTK